MQCCGKDRNSDFCPDCGNCLASSPRDAIKRFLTGKLRAAQAIQARGEQWDKEHPDNAHQRSRPERRQRQKDKVARFVAWLEWLEPTPPKAE